jgi:AcrR family transcriptional regulator
MPRLAAEVREARRDHILKAALRCFARRGYHLTSVDDIAAEAGVSKGAPYVYFESKEALFQQLHDSWNCGLTDRIGAALARLSDRDRRSPRMVLEAIVIAVGDHVEEEADLCRVLMEARTQAAYASGLAELVRASQAEAHVEMTRLIAAGIASGEWPADADAALHARLILASIHGLMAEWHLRPGSFSWRDMAGALASGWSRPR